MSPGTRVRFNDKCVWPERRGQEGVIVAPPTDGMYPQPAQWEVLVLLDHDPLTIDGTPDWWTCATSQDSLDEISGA